MTTSALHRIGPVRLAVASLALVGVALGAAGPGEPSTDRPDIAAAPDPIRASDPVALLADRIASGDVVLAWDETHGFLPALLDALEIPITSQALVFSRTSLQTDRIAPWAPRALYFNDDVYVGWVRDSPIIEIASVDPLEGSIFYTLAQREEGDPRFEREGTTCLMCHESGITEGVPGLIVRSVLTDRLGYPVTDVHEGQTTERTPFERRWGGWYVTGTHSEGGHAGNVKATELDAEIASRRDYLAAFDLHAGGNVTDLSDFFDTSAYLAPHSDIVAITVLTHQVRVHNLITLVHREGTRALGGMAAQKGRATRSTGRSVAAVDRLVRAMLFVDEAALPGAIQGTSDFVEEFSALGPKDSLGRSLRDFDLSERLFRHPLSFLVYSDAFDALPQFARNHIYDRFHEVLTGSDTGEDFAHLDAETRQALLDILIETKPEFAERVADR